MALKKAKDAAKRAKLAAREGGLGSRATMPAAAPGRKPALKRPRTAKKDTGPGVIEVGDPGEDAEPELYEEPARPDHLRAVLRRTRERILGVTAGKLRRPAAEGAPGSARDTAGRHGW